MPWMRKDFYLSAIFPDWFCSIWRALCHIATIFHLKELCLKESMYLLGCNVLIENWEFFSSLNKTKWVVLDVCCANDLWCSFIDMEKMWWKLWKSQSGCVQLVEGYAIAAVVVEQKDGRLSPFCSLRFAFDFFLVFLLLCAIFLW